MAEAAAVGSEGSRPLGAPPPSWNPDGSPPLAAPAALAAVAAACPCAAAAGVATTPRLDAFPPFFRVLLPPPLDRPPLSPSEASRSPSVGSNSELWLSLPAPPLLPLLFPPALFGLGGLVAVAARCFSAAYSCWRHAKEAVAQGETGVATNHARVFKLHHDHAKTTSSPGSARGRSAPPPPLPTPRTRRSRAPGPAARRASRRCPPQTLPHSPPPPTRRCPPRRAAAVKAKKKKKEKEREHTLRT